MNVVDYRYPKQGDRATKKSVSKQGRALERRRDVHRAVPVPQQLSRGSEPYRTRPAVPSHGTAAKLTSRSRGREINVIDPKVRGKFCAAEDEIVHRCHAVQRRWELGKGENAVPM